MRPRILFLGDSIRMGYAPKVQTQLGSLADVLFPAENCEDSRKIRKHIVKWLKLFDASTITLIHWNCGLHDIKRKFKSSKHQVPLQKYEENLRKILQTIRSMTSARIIWATTTPVIYERHHANKGFDRFPEDVTNYNQIATKIMSEAGIPINDLNEVIVKNNPAECILNDGVHMTDHAYGLLADAVVKKIQECIK